MALPPWTPTAAEIAALAGAHTRELGAGYDGTIVDVAAFTASTNPSLSQVTAFIVAACEEIIGRVDDPIEVTRYGLAHTAAQWHVVAQVHADRAPDEQENAGGAYRSAIANYCANLDALIRQARRQVYLA